MLSPQKVCGVIVSVLCAGGVLVGVEKLGLGAQGQVAVSALGNYVKQHVALGNVWFEQHNEDEVTVKTPAIGLHLNRQNAHLYQAVVLPMDGKQSDSTAEYHETIRLDPQLAAAYYKLGLSLRDLAHESLDVRDRARRLRDACRVFMLGANLATI